jgi:signal transduction histidine kinase
MVDFRSVFESGPGIYLLLLPDDKFTIVGATNGYCKATKRSREELTGKGLFEAFPDNPQDPEASGVANLNSSLQAVKSQKLPHKMALQKYDIPRDDGSFEERWWDPVNTPIVDNKGNIQYIVHQVADVTETVKLKSTVHELNELYTSLQRSEQELKDSRGKLENAVRARDELLSVCSHELRTPVASMKLQTQMTKRNLTKGDPLALAPERMKKLVEQADRQLDRLVRLIEEMLDFSRVQAGRLKLHLETVELAALIKEVVERFEPQAQAAQCDLTLNIAKPITGRWDPIRLEQLVTNLLGNAIKYAAGKPIQISLDENDFGARLSVKDEGMGIERENFQRIFEPYERAVSLSNFSGLGMGLYITKKVVDSHHGRIGVTSELGKGSTFTVELPLDPEQGSSRVG